MIACLNPEIKMISLQGGEFYAQGVKATVLFFDRKPASETPWTEKLWIYNLRINQHFTLKTNPLKLNHLQDFIKYCNPDNRRDRKETERFRAFGDDDLVKRDKASLDIFWSSSEAFGMSWKMANDAVCPPAASDPGFPAREAGGNNGAQPPRAGAGGPTQAGGCSHAAPRPQAAHKNGLTWAQAFRTAWNPKSALQRIKIISILLCLQ